MSGVATLKLRGAKRHFDEMSVDLPLPPQACSPARFVMRPPPFKRGRCNPSSSASRPSKSPTPLSNSTNTLPSTQHSTTPTTTPASTPTTQNLSEEELAALATHVPKRLKRVVEKVSRGELSLVDKIFSVVDLGEIVRSVLAERETKLSEDFTKILNERLAEQFRDFTKFNEDYVTRHLRGKDYSYLS